MKNIKLPILLFLLILFSGCEEVIDVNLETGTPKLVVDASLKWTKGTTGNEQHIRLTTTSDYYNTVVPIVTGATISVTNTDTNQVFQFNENAETKDYVCLDFVPIFNNNYTLLITNNGQTYTASERLVPVPPIDKIEQKVNDGFGGKYYEIKAFYTDNATTDDFYLFRYKTSFDVFPSYDVSEDEFYQGNQIFGLYISEDIKSGDTIDMSVNSVSRRYFNYMSKLIAIAGNGGVNPFQTPPAAVRGNVINTTNTDNYPLGYFNVSEVATQTYIVQ